MEKRNPATVEHDGSRDSRCSNLEVQFDAATAGLRGSKTSCYNIRNPDQGIFANAENLDLMTPKWLHLQILTSLPLEMKVGAVIRDTARCATRLNFLVYHLLVRPETERILQFRAQKPGKRPAVSEASA